MHGRLGSKPILVTGSKEQSSKVVEGVTGTEDYWSGYLITVCKQRYYPYTWNNSNTLSSSENGLVITQRFVEENWALVYHKVPSDVVSGFSLRELELYRDQTLIAKVFNSYGNFVLTLAGINKVCQNEKILVRTRLPSNIDNILCDAEGGIIVFESLDVRERKGLLDLLRHFDTYTA